MRLKLTVAYDGSGFCGWQSQAAGRAIQDVIEEAIARVNGVAARLHGAGRTDAGVHALGQAAHFDPAVSHDPEVWRRALNAKLPGDVRIMKVARVPANFHARFSAVGKIYEYRLWNHPVLSPLVRGRAWHVPGEVNIDAMRECAELFAGKHDFCSFCARRGNPSDADTIRLLTSIRLRVAGPDIRLRFEGEGFLYKMVRMLAAAIVQTGQGKVAAETWKDCLRHPSQDEKSRRRLVAPAEGLCLMRVKY